MIDITQERVFPLNHAPRQKELPRRRYGKRPHVATLYRWAKRGLCGVRLETISVGGTLCTSVEALQRFFAGLTDIASPPTQTSHRTRQQALAAQQVEADLNRLGL
jgi:hypothetical protein